MWVEGRATEPLLFVALYVRWLQLRCDASAGNRQ
jgi:hypothetical protein